ncbi:DNA-binding transcriptional regulator, MarR family [Bryocella elongata]|uniref:DNA-binding transcriptional regulator, MarR family n=1 Tax=Bryocella elongata TaxID=863522 RepID=A0A1H5S3I6_9BACT|nr:MarR family transcriptional regulator [Bryocella elongata]SEF45155.1 DNA-binding transcriptional regulator, MarR family [Bryocella elongata]
MFHEAPLSLGMLINRSARLGQRWLESRLSPLGVGAAAVPVLAALKVQDGMTQRELARRIGTEQPTMAQTLARMQRDGLILRSPNPADGRSECIHLTEKAKRVMPKIRELLVSGFAVTSKGFSTREMETLEVLLMRWLANMEAELGDPPAIEPLDAQVQKKTPVARRPRAPGTKRVRAISPG